MARLKKELKIIGVSLGVGILFAVAVAAYSFVYAHATQRDIAENVIRFHVRANSDSKMDQELKEVVRTQVLAEFESVLSAGASVAEMRTTLQDKLPAIEAYARDVVVRAKGYNYPVRVEMGSMFFPTQFYGSLSFPPGEYEAVQIIIGEGQGSNWWCLMFPPLCFVDMTGTDEGREQLQDTVTEEGFMLLTHAEEQNMGLTVRFRVVEWWQSRGGRIASEQNIANNR